MGEDRTLLLIKLGLVFVAPLAGFIISYLNYPTSISTASEEDDDEGEEGEEWSCRTTSTCYAVSGCGGGLKDALFLMQNEVGVTNIIHRGVIKRGTTSTESIPSDPRKSEDDECRLPPEVKWEGAEQETACERPNIEEKIESETQYLRNLAQSLCDSNRSLAAVRELENQLKVNSAESQSMSLRIESLKRENESLRSEAAEFSAVQRDLESSKSKVKQLKMKLRAADEQAKAKIASLEHKIFLQAEVDLQNKMMATRSKELEDEAAHLRTEKADLEQRLESADLSISTLEHSLVEVSKEMDKLRETNAKLEKTIEQLQSDCSAQSEELVHLRKKQLILDQYTEQLSWSSSSPESQNSQSDAGYSTTPTVFRDSPDLPTGKRRNSRKSKIIDKIKKIVLRKAGGSKKSKTSATPGQQSDAEDEETAGCRYSFDSNVSCFTEEEEGEGEEEEEGMGEEEDHHRPADDGLMNDGSMQKIQFAGFALLA